MSLRELRNRRQPGARVRWLLRATAMLFGLVSVAPHLILWAQPTQAQLAGRPTYFDPHSGPARMIYGLSLFTLEITGAIFIVVGGLWLYVNFRYRQRDPNDQSEPPQIYGSNQIELAWTVIPILIAVVLFLTTARVLFAIQDAPEPKNALDVDVVGHQFWWEFRYPKYGFVTANELHVPVSPERQPAATYLQLFSADVDHSFWIPQLFGKIDSIPNKRNEMWFTPDKAGLYLGQCAQFCGTQHAKMLLRVYVQPQPEFDAWLAAQQKPALADPSVAVGRQVFETQSCVSCHTIRGTAAHGRFGPDLTHLMSRDTIASGAAPNTDRDLKQWISDPDMVKPGSLMPAMHLTDDQVNTLVAYLETLH